MRTYARLLTVVALTPAVQAGPRPTDAVDNSADPEGPGVGPQYDGAHVYLAPSDMEPFIKSFIATFGGQAGAPASTTVTPTPSGARFALARTPVGPLSVLAFTTPPLSLRLGTGRLSSKGPRRRGRGGCGGRGRGGGRALRRSNRSRCDRSVARRRNHAVLLAQRRDIRAAARDHSRESGLRFAGESGRVRGELPSLL